MRKKYRNRERRKVQKNKCFVEKNIFVFCFHILVIMEDHVKVDKDVIVDVKVAVDVMVDGDVMVDNEGDVDVKIDGDVMVDNEGVVDVKIDGDVMVDNEGDVNVDIKIDDDEVKVDESDNELDVNIDELRLESQQNITIPEGRRKRKANSKYLDEPSPISKPAKKPSRRPSVVAKPSPPPVEVVPDLPAGPPTFGALIFGKDTHSVDSWIDDEEIVEEVIDEELFVDEEKEVVAGTKMEGTYLPSGSSGVSSLHAMIAPALVGPMGTADWLQFPNMSDAIFSEEQSGHVMTSLGGGSILGLLPTSPIYWLRDEIPKLSAYFKKKSGGSVKKPLPAKRVSNIIKADLESKRRERELEQKRILEERQKRKERERLKLLYRQHWIALTKFPIEDSVLHSLKGIRRLGSSPPCARQIAAPIVAWDASFANVVSEPPSADLADSVLVTWSFCSTFGWLFRDPMPPFTLVQLFEGLALKTASPLIADLHWSLIELMRPWLQNQLSIFHQAEQVWEAQLIRNRGRAKIFWPTFSQFRDFLHLGVSVLPLCDRTQLPGVWPWVFLYLVKAIVLFEGIDLKREFLASVSASFEEFDFRDKYIASWEKSISYESIGFSIRVKSLKAVIDKILSLGLFKKTIDVFCDAKLHIGSEISLLEKDERKGTQKIALSQKLIAIVEEARETSSSIDVSGIQIPLSPIELEAEIALRDAIQIGKKTALNFADKWLGVRLEPLGRDRHFNEYFQVSFNKRIVFVRKTDPNNLVAYGVYDSLASLECLIQSLDERGVRECALKNELQTVKTNLYADLVSEGEPDLANKTQFDWLANYTGWSHSISLPETFSDLQPLKPLNDCVLTARKSLTMIRACWYGERYTKLKKPLVKVSTVGRPPKPVEQEVVDDDVTVDEDIDEPEDEVMEEEEVEETEVEKKNFEFLSEKETLFKAISFLINVLTKCIKDAFIAHSAESVLVEFHVKSGIDFLRHAGVPVSMVELEKFASDAVLSLTVPLLDGLLAIEEVVQDEIARHGQFVGGLDIDVWPASGGEKAAWKLFLGQWPESRPTDDEEGAPVEEVVSLGTFPCEQCGKTFRLHILLGLHKLKPCKSRGRKPIPSEPQIEVLEEVAAGPAAIEGLVLPQFPAPPSSRQTEAATVVVSDANGSFVCEICGKVFPQNQGLAVHQTRWCIPEQQAQLILTAQQAVGGLGIVGGVQCETCGKLYPTAQGLAIHQSRWCKKSEEPILTSLEHRTISKSNDSELFINLEESYEDPGHVEPGYTPACYSISAITLSTFWLGKRIENAVDKFNKVHHSGAIQSKKK